VILVDTSVWIDHLRYGNKALGEFLSEAFVLLHPFVIGELACGNLKDRTGLLRDLNTLPKASAAGHEEVLRLIEDGQLAGRGIGWVDAHLLASALISQCLFWTLDERLRQAGAQVGARLYGA